MTTNPGHEAKVLRKRGRPRKSSDPHRVAADEAIGRTVWQLMAWGFTLRGANNAAEVVGKLAREVLKLQDHVGGCLSERTIEETFDSWSKSATRQTGWKTAPVVPIGKPWTGINVNSLRDRSPHGYTLEALARVLLGNQGVWPHREQLPGHYAPLGDPEMTAGARSRHAATAPRFSGIVEIDGVAHDTKKSGAENSED